MLESDEEFRTTTPPQSASWLAAGFRSAIFLRPRIMGLLAGPRFIALLVLALVGTGVLLQRSVIDGPATFYWQAIAGGWLATALWMWACWLAARSTTRVPDAATLFAVLLVQQLVMLVPIWGIYLMLPRAMPWLARIDPKWAPWGVSMLMVAWSTLAGLVLVMRQTAPQALLRVSVLAACLLAGAIDIVAPPFRFWYPAEKKETADDKEGKRLKLTQEVMERQAGVVIESLQRLQPQRPGVTDVYAITFAPYEGEEVFRRESALVVDTMETRFDARGHTLQLINHAETAAGLPWATGLNLQRAIHRVASLMDKNEDILFIHLTSHGSKGAKLAANFWPVEVADVTGAQVRQWLDEAGVRFRVVSVSACYAGGWIGALAEPNTLVMTASDADHTSYGCGHQSELTFFGRAMYGEQLRTQTRSFEAAHAQARKVIEQREKDAGKTDGFSNPQISVGEAIKPKLDALAMRVDTAGR